MHVVRNPPQGAALVGWVVAGGVLAATAGVAAVVLELRLHALRCDGRYNPRTQEYCECSRLGRGWASLLLPAGTCLLLAAKRHPAAVHC
jgi:hypothetical protein